MLDLLDVHMLKAGHSCDGVEAVELLRGGV